MQQIASCLSPPFQSSLAVLASLHASITAQAPPSARTHGSSLRLVPRVFDTRDLKEAKALLEEYKRVHRRSAFGKQFGFWSGSGNTATLTQCAIERRQRR